LQKTREGCQYLIDRWLNVEALLLKAGGLTSELCLRILDLLGTPADTRAAGLTELDARPGDTSTMFDRAQAIIERELARLRTLLDSPELQEADENARQRALDGIEPWESKEGRLLIRYRTHHARRYEWCLNELKRRRNERARQARAVGSLLRSDVPRSPAPPSDKPAPAAPTASAPPVSQPAASASAVRPMTRSERRSHERTLPEIEQRQRRGLLDPG
jgi:hypothetical protein